MLWDQLDETDLCVYSIYCGYQSDAAPVQEHNNLFANGSLLTGTTSVRQMGVQSTRKKKDRQQRGASKQCDTAQLAAYSRGTGAR